MAIKLSSIDQFEQVIEENKYVFVLKHSETCPISANAYDQFNKFYMNAIWTVIIWLSNKNAICQIILLKTNVKHESPQAFYFVNGEMVWNRDHGDINVSSLAQAEE